MSNDHRTVLAMVPKNATQEIQVALDQYKGVDLLDVRVFANFSGVDQRKPTKQGISIKVARLPELIAALLLAEVEARRRGLLDGEQGGGK